MLHSAEHIAISGTPSNDHLDGSNSAHGHEEATRDHELTDALSGGHAFGPQHRTDVQHHALNSVQFTDGDPSGTSHEHANHPSQSTTHQLHSHHHGA